jgi:hypothetical protein
MATAEVTIHPKEKSRAPRWPFVVLLAIACVVFVWYGMMYGHKSGWITRLVSAVIPVPAVVVNGDTISYHDLLVRTDTLLWLKGEDADQEKTFAQAIDVLIEQTLIEQIAEEYDVEVTRDEKDAVLAMLAGELDEEAFEEKIRGELDMSLREFTRVVVEPLALAQKLETVVHEDEETQAEVKAEAEEARTRIVAGMNFSEAAALYSQDPSGAQGGDVGYLTKATLPAGWDVLLTLPEEGMSGVIETEGEFVILKVAWLVGVGEDTQIRTQAIILKKKTLSEIVASRRETSDISYVVKNVDRL